jgi:multicomponent Na+:H+ antiporter subunit G
MIARAIIGSVFLFIGMFVFATGIRGIFKMRYVINRVHVAAFCQTLGMLTTTAGLCVISGLTLSTLKLIVIMLFIWITNPVLSSMVTKAEILSNDDPEEYEVVKCRPSSK